MSEINAGRIARWRAVHVGETLTEGILCDLIGAKDLIGADLRYANLRDADLRYVDLRGANLWDADLRDADLRGADLRDADLRGVGLRYANLRRADLRGVGLRDADLYRANMYGADLRHADLYGADLWGTNLYEADLCGANLYGAGLPGSFPIAVPSGEGLCVPTPDGLRLNIGCWQNKSLADLRALLVDKIEWPEAVGDERERRRPFLAAVLAQAEATEEYYKDYLVELAEEWREE